MVLCGCSSTRGRCLLSTATTEAAAELRVVGARGSGLQ